MCWSGRVRFGDQGLLYPSRDLLYFLLLVEAVYDSLDGISVLHRNFEYIDGNSKTL